MHTAFFNGRQLSAESFNAEQTYLSPHRSLGGRLDAVALNPQPLPPKSMSEAVAASLPASLLDEVALNPQPLPPRSASGQEPPAAERQQALQLLTDLFDKLGDAMRGVISNIK
jgi:hypothetical protein